MRVRTILKGIALLGPTRARRYHAPQRIQNSRHAYIHHRMFLAVRCLISDLRIEGCNVNRYLDT